VSNIVKFPLNYINIFHHSKKSFVYFFSAKAVWFLFLSSQKGSSESLGELIEQFY